MENQTLNEDQITPPIRRFLEELEESKQAFVAKDYGRNGRLGPWIRDVTEPPDYAGNREYVIRWHEFSCIHCDSDDDVMSELADLKTRIFNKPDMRFAASVNFYRYVESNIRVRFKTGDSVLSQIWTCYEAAREVVKTTAGTFGLEPTTESSEAVRNADLAYQAVIDITEDRYFEIDVDRYKTSHKPVFVPKQEITITVTETDMKDLRDLEEFLKKSKTNK